jgi:hypothetical protein
VIEKEFGGYKLPELKFFGGLKCRNFMNFKSVLCVTYTYGFQSFRFKNPNRIKLTSKQLVGKKSACPKTQNKIPW